MKLREACAVFGVSLSDADGDGDAVGMVYNGLLSTQHRGQEAAGIAVLQGNNIICHKSIGLVSEIFSNAELHELAGTPVIGHTLYNADGANVRRGAQPFVTEFLTGRIALAHNGNITNVDAVRQLLTARGVNITAGSGSEVFSALVAYKIRESGDVLAGVTQAAAEVEGAFSAVILSSDGKLIAMRDQNGFRPLCVGTGPLGTAVASESCALDSVGFSLVDDVRPGEIVVIENGKITNRVRFKNKQRKEAGLCIFEFVYFARSDSVIDKLCVYDARFHMGEILAREHPADADVVCGVPDSGIDAAMGYAAASGLPLAPGFVKNRYIGRSFIYPTKIQRENAVKLKLNPLRANLEGKRIVLVDDSVVRGTTCAQIIGVLKDAGAREVHMRISSPPFRYTCHYGTEIGDEKNLIANRMDIDEIRQSFGADSLGYISRKGLIEACSGCTLPFCTGCFSGHDAEMEV